MRQIKLFWVLAVLFAMHTASARAAANESKRVPCNLTNLNAGWNFSTWYGACVDGHRFGLGVILNEKSEPPSRAVEIVSYGAKPLLLRAIVRNKIAAGEFHSFRGKWTPVAETDIPYWAVFVRGPGGQPDKKEIAAALEGLAAVTGELTSDADKFRLKDGEQIVESNSCSLVATPSPARQLWQGGCELGLASGRGILALVPPGRREPTAYVEQGRVLGRPAGRSIKYSYSNGRFVRTEWFAGGGGVSGFEEKPVDEASLPSWAKRLGELKNAEVAAQAEVRPSLPTPPSGASPVTALAAPSQVAALPVIPRPSNAPWFHFYTLTDPNQRIFFVLSTDSKDEWDAYARKMSANSIGRKIELQISCQAGWYAAAYQKDPREGGAGIVCGASSVKAAIEGAVELCTQKTGSKCLSSARLHAIVDSGFVAEKFQATTGVGSESSCTVAQGQLVKGSRPCLHGSDVPL